MLFAITGMLLAVALKDAFSISTRMLSLWCGVKIVSTLAVTVLATAMQQTKTEHLYGFVRMISAPMEEKGTVMGMAENYKHLYKQTKNMLTMYQDEVVPVLRNHIKELEYGRRWIPVTERLPEEWTRVLVCLHNHICVVARHISGEWVVSWSNGECKGVTHWMPLPELPNKQMKP